MAIIANAPHMKARKWKPDDFNPLKARPKETISSMKELKAAFAGMKKGQRVR